MHILYVPLRLQPTCPAYFAPTQQHPAYTHLHVLHSSPLMQPATPFPHCGALQAGLTPLHRAAMKGHTAVVDTLLAAGADKDAKNNVRCGLPMHTFMHACNPRR